MVNIKHLITKLIIDQNYDETRTNKVNVILIYNRMLN